MAPNNSISLVLARMQINLDRGLGIRLSNDDLHVLSTSFVGQAMVEAKEEWTKQAPKQPTSSGQEGAEMGAKTAIVMPEDEWFKLCAKQCRARRKQYGGTRKECLDEFECGICSECASDAHRAAPKKYRTTPEVASGYDPLPGMRP